MEPLFPFGLLFLILCTHEVNAGNDANMGNTGGTNTDHDEPGYADTDGEKIVFTSIVFEPYLKKSDDESATGNDRYVGFIPDLVKELAQRLDLEYELKLVEDNKWGSRDSHTGKWNGMIGEVINGNAKIVAAAPITITPKRQSVVDFTSVFQNVSVTALVRSDSKYKTLDEILADKNLTLGCIAMGSTARQIKSDRKYTDLWSKMENSFVTSIEEGVDKVLGGNFAFFMEKPTAKYAVAKDCRLKNVGDMLESQGYAFPLLKNDQKSRKLRENIDKAFADMQKERKLQEIESAWWSPPAEQTCGASKGVITSLALILLAFIFGLGA